MMVEEQQPCPPCGSWAAEHQDGLRWGEAVVEIQEPWVGGISILQVHITMPPAYVPLLERLFPEALENQCQPRQAALSKMDQGLSRRHLPVF